VALFGFGKKKAQAPPTPPPPPPQGPGYDPARAVKALVELLERRLTDPDGRIRVEDLLSAAAAVTGQACIAASGEFDPERHDFVPGQAVLSERINGVICSDVGRWEAVSVTDSVFGIVYDQAQTMGYAAAEFPAVSDVLQLYVSQIGHAAWGSAPLSVDPSNRPRRLPLQAGYELSGDMRAYYAAQQVPLAGRPLICALALSVILSHVKAAIDHGVALRIVLETVNAMAKMAPMTKLHMDEAIAKQAQPAPPPG
jgi:hypothetical protein